LPLRAGALAAAVWVVLVPFERHARVYLSEVADDTRDRVRRWACANLPADSYVAVGLYTGFGDVFPDAWGGRALERSPLPPVRTVEFRFIAEEVNTAVAPKRRMGGAEVLAALREQGFTHAVVAEPAWDRFFRPGNRPRRTSRRWFDQHRAFYEALFTRGTLLHEERPAEPMRANTSPTVRVYRLPQRARGD
jgi:hypothetical protein